MRRLTILLAAVGALTLIPTAAAFANGTAHVLIAGSGSGKVTGGQLPGNPPINCSYDGTTETTTGTCEAELEFEEEEGVYAIILGRAPAPGSQFSAWIVEEGNVFSGCSEPTGGCALYVPNGSEDVTVIAVFEAGEALVPVSVSTSGGGEGTVTSEPAGIDCGLECSAEFPLESNVVLNAKPAHGSEFAKWEGACAGFGSILTCHLNHLEKAKAATAVFKPCSIGSLAPSCANLKLNVEEGSGTIISNPAGLACTTTAPGSCEVLLAEGKVTLTASPAPGYLVKSWKGCDAGGVNGRQCTVTATSSLKTVGVKFYPVFSLEGSKSGGQGIMGTAPGGINCGYACSSSSALFKEGSLTVKAKPAKHFHFVEFTGGTGSAESCNGVTAESCTIASFNSDSVIEEVYAEDAKNTLTLTKEGGGQGFVKTKPTNVNCGLTCTAAEAEFFASESPEVSVTLGKGTSSVTWVSGAGTCTGNALTCTVPMSEDHELVAKFN